VAAALPVAGVTAWRALLELGRLREAPAPERRVLVLGASGGVGQFCVQIAHHEGAFVAGVCSGRNAELVRGLGADVVLDYGASDPLEQARAHAPFQVVVDCVGGYAGAACRSLLRSGGRHVMVAGESAGQVVQAVLHPIRSKSLLGAPNGARLAPLVDGVAAGWLHVNVVHRIPLGDVVEAHRISREGRTAGKIILVP
jgi:NADPH:quinone reductase-like Zn-dependent oxidoreductase